MLTGLGLNVDAMNPDGRPDPVLLKEAGFSWVRLVAHLTPEVRTYVADCEEQGLDVLLVIARESEPGPYAAVFDRANYWQIGNEPDLASPSSWTMTPHEYAALWNSMYLPLLERVVYFAGLASGNPQWLADTLALLDRQPDAIAIHPYGQAPTPDFPVPWSFGQGGVGALLDAYQRVAGAIQLIVTEYGANVDEVTEDFQAAYLPAMASTLLARGVPAAVFAWSDNMVPRFGLIRSDGTPRPSFSALQGVAMPDPKPQFVLGFADLAQQLGADVVGEPKEAEGYFPDGSHSLQVTSKGVMLYSKAGNQAGFLPFAQA